PGTGISDVTTLSSGRRKAAVEREVPPSILGENQPRPSLFASKAERQLSIFLKDIYGADDSVNGATDVVGAAGALKVSFPKLAPAMDLISVLHGIRDEATSDAASALAKKLWQERDVIFNNRLVRKYFAGIYPGVQITEGIFSVGSYTSQTLGFIVSEILQKEEKYQEAIAVLNEMRPDQLVGIALADIEITAGDFDGAIETTEDIENEDDATAMMLVLRGVAFREKGLDDAALECFKRAIAKKARSEGVIHRGLFERAMTYKKLGKKAAAKKDLEKILVDDPKATGVNEALAAL
ncbi:MAG: tetratricopeptide repeat protein, partial [Candidatus Planktophila sp.]